MEVVTFGESMVLFSTDKSLPLEYVHHFNKQMAGAESNVAIGLAKLGHRVGWFSKLGDDPFGRYVLHQIRGYGIDTSRCISTPDAPTGVFFKEQRSRGKTQVYYYRHHSAASLMKPDELDEEYLSGFKILHITGITPALSSNCLALTRKAIAVAKERGLKIVFDPNVRWKLWDSEEAARKIMLELADSADYVLPGLDEGELLTGLSQPEDIAAALLKPGVTGVVVKLGGKGAYYKSAQHSGYMAPFPAEEVDPVGAGDAFAAGFISGLLHGEKLEQAVLRASAMGAIAVGFNGDVEGLPDETELLHRMNSKDDYQNVKR
ncbi:2-dehydro-3-deoxygluconokinase [Fontibacillus solani]|uniref:2-dehydro-3-deoxygluconokinase n=1 Tax=Fontibacillus solani TaxID=1572857 RepID=A0A7W3SRV5_9BACL|nr:sugar kinase [Fontibacillus solani]MBA9084893.1 2-dehydro-3-deoxygluconokinase [Fontibacillus solani]